MKKGILFITLTSFLSTASMAQVGAGMVASSVMSKSTVVPDLNLKASFNNNTAEITWNGVAKSSVRRYELEKSSDGENFGYVTAFAGTQKSYLVKDNSLLENLNFYRVKVVDSDGNFIYSGITSFDTKKNLEEIRILPTQINQKLFVWLPVNTTISKAVISDASGRMLKNYTQVYNVTNIAAIEMANLPAGFYNLKLQTNKGEIIKLKFNKQS